MTVTEIYPVPPELKLLKIQRAYTAEVLDGILRILSGLEPYHEGGSVGLHVSVSHSTHRPVTDEEASEIIATLYGQLPCEEGSVQGSHIRQFWELKQTESQP